MIKNIKINNIRNLKNFDSGKLLQYNLVYACNGSGKSNITKVLNYYSENKYIDNLNDIKSLEAIEKGEEILHILDREENNKIYTFNDVFVNQAIAIEDNFSNKNHDGHINIGKIGKENIELEKLVKQQKNIKIDGLKLKETLEKNIKNKTLDVCKKYNTVAKVVNEFINIDKFESKELISKFDLSLIDSKTYNEYEEVSNIGESDKITFNFNKLTNLDESKLPGLFYEKLNILTEQKEISSYIEKTGNTWIASGIHKYNELGYCPFCKNEEVSNILIEGYNGYLESKDSKFKANIDNQIRLLENYQEFINKNNNFLKNSGKVDIERKIKLLSMDITLDNFPIINNLEKIIELLKEKKNDLSINLFEKHPTLKSELDIFFTSINTYNIAVDNNINVINKVNSKITNNSSILSNLRKKISKFECIKFYFSEKELIENRIKLKEEYTELQKLIKIEEDNVSSITGNKKQLIVNIMKTLFNTLFISKYDIDNDFNLILKSNSNYTISDNTNLISNGEKNVIGFCYYVASIIKHIDKLKDLENITLVIDDPVESTSYNYLHGISVIISKIGNIISGALEESNIVSPQFIIFTHNLNFYNGFFQNIGKKYMKEGEGQILHIANDNNYCIGLKPINIKKIKIINEFDTSLKAIIDYKNDKNSDNIGVHLRRVLESLCYFYNLEYSGESINKIFNIKNPEFSKNTTIFITHDYTHLTPQKIFDAMPTDNLYFVVEEIYNNLNNGLFKQKIKLLESI